MDLYLIRHADAAPLGESGSTDDATRPLTAEGQQQARDLAGGLKRRQIHPSIVVTSPLLRARQTAETMLDSWGAGAPPLRECEDLASGGRRRKLLKFLRDLGQDHVALVGHQPDLGEFGAWLIGSRKAQLDLDKGGVACLRFAEEMKKGMARLVWLVTPAWLSS
jgi:phosphohistidine phosphatase